MSRLLLAPGWSMEAAVWEPLRADLAKIAECVSIDWRGIKRRAEFTSRVRVEAARSDAPVIIVGWSLGALAALDFAARDPSLVSKLILIGATSRFTIDDGYDAGQDPRAVLRMSRQLARAPEKTLRRFRMSMFSDRERARGDDARFMADVQARFAGDTVESLIVGLDYLRTVDLRGALPNQPPMLLLHGEEDPICPPQAAKYVVERAERATLRIIPQSGHLPFYTQPHICSREIERFLRGEQVDR